jgi:hypothetical protein
LTVESAIFDDCFVNRLPAKAFKLLVGFVYSPERSFMKTSILEKIGLLALLLVFGFGCSVVNSFRKQQKSGSTNTSPQSSDKPTEAAAASPCQNRYHPVKEGRTINYEMNNSLGKSTAKIVQKYTPSEATFTEDWTFGKTEMKQVWQCTPEGIIAPNYGSMLNSYDLKVEPRRISGVTLPPEDELVVGKTWTAVYESKAQMPSGLGETVTNVTVNNKVVSLDDEVKTPGGTFKAMKVESNLDIATKFNGKNIPVPPIKTATWFAPDVGMVKSGLDESQFGKATMEYVGSN